MSGAELAATEPSDAPESDDRDLALAVEKLEAQIEQVYRPLLKDTVPELESRLDEKDAKIEQLEDRIDQLEARVESLVGVPEEDASTPEKRVRDAKQILLRRAEANDAGRASMYWRELANSLAEHGHGDLYDTQVKRAMEEVAESPGYTLATGQRDVSQADDRSDVRDVQVVQCDADAVPGGEPINNVVGGNSPGVDSQNSPDDQPSQTST